MRVVTCECAKGKYNRVYYPQMNSCGVCDHTHMHVYCTVCMKGTVLGRCRNESCTQSYFYALGHCMGISTWRIKQLANLGWNGVYHASTMVNDWLKLLEKLSNWKSDANPVSCGVISNLTLLTVFLFFEGDDAAAIFTGDGLLTDYGWNLHT